MIAHLYLAWIHPLRRRQRTHRPPGRVPDPGPGRGAHAVRPSAEQPLQRHANRVLPPTRPRAPVQGRRGAVPSYAVRGLVDGLREQVDLIRGEQWSAAWRDFVQERFLDKRTAGDLRRLHLVLDLSNAAGPLPRGKLAEISPRVAREYARKTPKTLTRDLNLLRAMDLITSGPHGYEANRRLMLAFMPLRKRTVS